MPHFNIEYSGHLEQKVDMARLCRLILREILATGLFEIGAVRVRATRVDHYAIADDLDENGYIDMTLRIGTGRSLDDRKRVGEAIFVAVVEELKLLFDTPHFALSFEIREIDPDLSWRKNAIHPRLRAVAGQDKLTRINK